MSDESGIVTYAHCAQCIEEMPMGTSPKKWKRLEVGFLEDGRLMIWCERHKMPVAILNLANPIRRSCAACGDPDCGTRH